MSPFLKLAAHLSAVILVSSSCRAWETVIDSDPLTDEATVFISQTTSDGQMAVTFKCFDGHPDDTLIMAIANEPWEATMADDTGVSVTLRIDKNTPVEVPLAPQNKSGKLLGTMNAGSAHDVVGVLFQMAEAKTSFGFGFRGVSTRLPIKKLSAAATKMIEVCHLKRY